MAGEVNVVGVSLGGVIEDGGVKADGGVAENISSFGSSDVDIISDESFANCGEDNNNGLQARLLFIAFAKF